jgi:hypothetical protein
MDQAKQQAMEELQLNGRPMDFTDEQRNIYATLPDENKEKLRNFMNRFRDNAERNPELYSNFIHSVFAKSILEQAEGQEPVCSCGGHCGGHHHG